MKMNAMKTVPAALVAISLFLCHLPQTAHVAAADPKTIFRSHPPTRPLPVTPDRPLGRGPGFFVDPQSGDDQAEGSQAKPWQTIQRGIQALKPGDTLYLRGGTYYEHVTVTHSGTAEKPITIRSYPSELAVLDGGLRAFFDDPAHAWEPCPNGAAGEFRSVKIYPELGGAAGQTNLLGNFGDSMVPLHGYRFLSDLRSGNEYFAKFDEGKTQEGSGINCGPGVFYDPEAGRIHVRLAHTHQKALGADNYRGETDPRKLPLVIAGQAGGSPLTIRGASHIRIQDLVVRGARAATVSVSDSANIEFDGVTAYGGSAPFQVRDTSGLRLVHCACRGIAAPWTYRGSLKYRAIEARLFSASGWNPTGVDSRDFELAYSEFTDSVDGVFIGNVRGVKFHHNLLDNVSDDGVFLTATTAYDGTTSGGDVHIYQNLLSRCLTTFAFGVGHGRQKTVPGGKQTGSGVFIYRNVFDFRRPVMYHQPAEDEDRITSYGRVAGDHGGPAWEPIFFYHNTVLSYDPPFRGYYGAGLGGHMGGGTKRRVFNNIFAQVEGFPGRVLPEIVLPDANPARATEKNTQESKKPADPLDELLDGAAATKNPNRQLAIGSAGAAAEKPPMPPPSPVDFQADGNLHWSYQAELQLGELLKAFQQSPQFTLSKRLYAPGWTRRDVVSDPQFVKFVAHWSTPWDLRLQSLSPAVDAGADLASKWIDPLRAPDKGKPDIGVLPAGEDPWRIGVRGRLSVFGETHESEDPPSMALAEFKRESQPLNAQQPPRKPAAIVEGYPAFDAPLVRFALRRRGVAVDDYERRWLDTKEYGNYGLVVIVGDLVRAKTEPNKFDAEDLPRVKAFLENGGTLLLMRGTTALFAAPEGRAFLTELVGASPAEPSPEYRILQPAHPWLKHLAAADAPPWVNARNAVSLRTGKGERLIGTPAGAATLYQLPVGKGRLIYIGWELATSLPSGRRPSTIEDEKLFEDQMQILLQTAADACP